MASGSRALYYFLIGRFQAHNLPDIIKVRPIIGLLIEIEKNDWIAVCIRKVRKTTSCFLCKYILLGEIFNPLGIEIPYAVFSWLDLKRIEYIVSNKKLLREHSSVSQMFCIYYLFHKFQKRSLHDIIMAFDEDMSTNEIIVQNFINELRNGRFFVLLN